MEKRIYLDQAATSFPKAEGVAKAVSDYLLYDGVNVNRGGYQSAYDTAMEVYETRREISSLFDFDKPENVIFTPNVTYALNYIIKGLLQPGDHVLVSSMEHNAVMRPLVQLQKERGILFDRVPCTSRGELLEDKMDSMLTTATRAIVMTHASNVCGTILPIEKVGAFAKKHGLFFIVDAAQSAGILPISMKKMQIDALAFTGHKGLMGPQGIGGFLVSDALADEMTTLVSGGTGSVSDTEETPDFLPDKFEAGTPNLPGILGLKAALGELKRIGISRILEKERKLTQQFLDGMNAISGIRCIGLKTAEGRTAVVSLQCDKMDESQLAFLLDQQYHICTRVGMHCAPNAHKTLQTFPRGTIRFSFGCYNKEEEVHAAIEAVGRLIKEVNLTL